MRGAEEKNSPWNWAGVSSYELRYKTAWYEYIIDIKDICAKLDAKTAAESGERLEKIAKAKTFDVDYEAAGGVDPHEGHSAYTPTKTPFNLDKYYIVTELRACTALLKDVSRGHDVVNMDFFYRKSLECLQHVQNVPWMSTSWHTEAFARIESDCRDLSAALNAAKESEASLLAWRTRLMDAKKVFGGEIQKTDDMGVGRVVQYKKVEYINGEIMTCRKLITEMLCILNPGEKKYQIWFALGDRERFLKDIGFQQGRMPEIVHIRGLLSRMQELAA